MNNLKIIYLLISVVTILILCSPTKGQKVIFTDRDITLHLVKNFNRDKLVEKQIDQIIELILNETENTNLEQKGLALTDLLKSLRDDLIVKNDNLFSRNKRGIPFLGRLIHQITDLPGPDQFKAIQILTKKNS